MLRVLLVAFLTLTAGCMDVPSFQERDPIDPIEEVMGPAPLQLSQSNIVGTGRIRAQASLPTPRSPLHLRVMAQFLDSDSALYLHVFFDNFQRDNGLILKLQRHEAESQTLEVNFAEPGMTYIHLTDIENGIGADGTFELRIDLSQQLNNQRRILIWNEALYLNSLQRVPRDRLTTGNAEYDSLEAGQIFFRWGRGLRWGARLDQVRLIRFQREVGVADL